ncbi:MAG: L-histidine N(alpha)-methyltransferase [Myxococcota bacterium]|nr:L-histidine N(alpha)-methyltransferase [Myxococcota bacterium]
MSATEPLSTTTTTPLDGGGSARFLDDVLAGLARAPRSLPCKYLYDKRGSVLFDAITELDEYYLTRAETELLHAHAAAIAARLGPRVDLVELGSGSSIKTRILLDALDDVARYVPVDISAQHLRDTARSLVNAYPEVAIEPLVADYAKALAPMPLPPGASRRVVFFPGSSLGNFEPLEAVAFLARARSLAGRGGIVLIGVDIPKDASIIEPAYDDREGVTAAFNKNLLERINRELGGDFDLDAFTHRAPWDPARRRVEMQLVSTREQTVTIGGRRFPFDVGEHIVTEHCYKHGVEDLRSLARDAGLTPGPVWLDPRERMSMHWLDAP